jgi:hypothetical protein
MKIKRYGIIGLMQRIIKKVSKKVSKRVYRMKEYNYLKHYFYGKNGIEIGGPSGIFSDGGFFPIYKIIGNLDGVNFSDDTVWTKKIGGGGGGVYLQW